MKYASDSELDIGLTRTHQVINGLRQQGIYARTPEERRTIQRKLREATEELDMIEREQIRRMESAEAIFC